VSGGHTVPPCMKQHKLVHVAVDGLHGVALRGGETSFSSVKVTPSCRSVEVEL